jgi:hypothetical protein
VSYGVVVEPWVLQGLGGAQTEGAVRGQELAQQILLEHTDTYKREREVSGAVASNREKREEGGWGVAFSWPSLSFVINGVDPSMRVSLSLIF